MNVIDRAWHWPIEKVQALEILAKLVDSQPVMIDSALARIALCFEGCICISFAMIERTFKAESNCSVSPQDGDTSFARWAFNIQSRRICYIIPFPADLFFKHLHALFTDSILQCAVIDATVDCPKRESCCPSTHSSIANTVLHVISGV